MWGRFPKVEERQQRKPILRRSQMSQMRSRNVVSARQTVVVCAAAVFRTVGHVWIAIPVEIPLVRVPICHQASRQQKNCQRERYAARSHAPRARHGGAHPLWDRVRQTRQTRVRKIRSKSSLLLLLRQDHPFKNPFHHS